MSSSVCVQLTPRILLSVIVLSILWGCSFFFVEVALEQLPPMTLAALRVSGAALALWSLVLAVGESFPASLSVWRNLLVIGVLNNAIPFSLIMYAQTVVTGSLASILNSATPLFTIVVAGLLLSDERMTLNRIFGVLLGFAGVVVVIGPAALAEAGENLIAQLALLTAALCYACSAVFVRAVKITLQLQPNFLAAGQVTMAALALVPAALLYEGPIRLAAFDLPTAGAVAGLAVLSTALAYLVYFRILRRGGATNALLATFLVPVSAVFLGVMILGESLSMRQVAGMIVIAAGLIAMDGRLFRRRLRAPSE